MLVKALDGREDASQRSERGHRRETRRHAWTPWCSVLGEGVVGSEGGEAGAVTPCVMAPGCHSACSLLVTDTSLFVSVSLGSGPQHWLVASALSSAVWPPPLEFGVKSQIQDIVLHARLGKGGCGVGFVFFSGGCKAECVFF